MQIWNVAGLQPFRRCLKPRPHQQQRRSNIVECYKSNERCFDIVAGVDEAY